MHTVCFDDEVESRARLIATTAQRMVDHFEDPSEYCHPACMHCAIEMARTDLEVQPGWTCCDAARSITDAAVRLATHMLGATTVEDRIP